MWAIQDQHQGDRRRLFSAVHAEVGGSSVLYPGSYVDIAPSMVFPDVTYVDVDKRARSFFGDDAGIQSILRTNGVDDRPGIRFIHADYTSDLDLPTASFDLLVSLYAGFVSEFCTQYLKIGGALLVAPSHGDVAMASIDDRYELIGTVKSVSGDYRITFDDLDSYLVPKADVTITRDSLHDSGRGIAYTRSAFAYLFRRIQ